MKIISKLTSVFGLVAFAGLITILSSQIFKSDNHNILLYGFIIMGTGLIPVFILRGIGSLMAEKFIERFTKNYSVFEKNSLSIPVFANNYGNIDFKNISNLISIDKDIFMFTNSYRIQTMKGVRNQFQKEKNINFLIQKGSEGENVFLSQKNMAGGLISKLVIPIMSGKTDDSLTWDNYFYVRSENNQTTTLIKLEKPLSVIKNLYRNKIGTAIDNIPTPFDIRITKQALLFRTNYDCISLLPELVDIMKEIRNSL